MPIFPFPGVSRDNDSKQTGDHFQQLCQDATANARSAADRLPRHPARPRQWLEVDMHLKLAGDHLTRATLLYRQQFGDPPL